MKQVILIEQTDLAQLKLGRTLNMDIGGQIISIGLELNGRAPKKSTGESAAAIRRRLMSDAVESETHNETRKRRKGRSFQCKQCEHKPFKTQSAFMKHRRAEHPNGKKH